MVMPSLNLSFVVCVCFEIVVYLFSECSLNRNAQIKLFCCYTYRVFEENNVDDNTTHDVHVEGILLKLQ